jgi:hypothetical protein
MPHVYEDFFQRFREGSLQFSVVVAAEGTDPMLRVIELKWNGSWEHFEVTCRSVDGFE